MSFQASSGLRWTPWQRNVFAIAPKSLMMVCSHFHPLLLYLLIYLLINKINYSFDLVLFLRSISSWGVYSWSMRSSNTIRLKKKKSPFIPSLGQIAFCFIDVMNFHVYILYLHICAYSCLVMNVLCLEREHARTYKTLNFILHAHACTHHAHPDTRTCTHTRAHSLTFSITHMSTRM